MTTPRFRTLILNSMARSLWVEAYMSEVGERAGEANDPTVKIDPKAVEIQRCSSGRDWMDMAPSTPLAAHALAVRLCAQVEELSGMGIEDGFIIALVADLRGLVTSGSTSKHLIANAVKEMDTSEEGAEAMAVNFGHYIVMESLGHGVGWEDDHAHMPLKMLFSFDNYELRGLVKFE